MNGPRTYRRLISTQWIVVVVTIAILPFLFFKSHGVEAHHHLNIVDKFIELKALNDAYAKEIFQVRFRKTLNYDKLAEQGRIVQQRAEALHDLLSPGMHGVGEREISNYLVLLDSIHHYVELFKSNYSILRNARRGLPNAINNAIETHPDFHDDTVDALRHINVLVMQYNLTSDPEDRKTAIDVMAALKKTATGFAPEKLGAIALIRNQAQMVLDKKDEVDGFVRAAIAVPTGKALDLFFDAYMKSHNRQIDVAEKYRFGLLVAAGFLLLWMIAALVRLTRFSSELEVKIKELNFQKFALDQHAIVSMTDVKGNITYANDRFCEISKFSRDELIGVNHRIIKSGEHPVETFRNMWRTIANGEVWHGEVKNRAKDGSHYWVSSTIVPILGETGKPIQYVSIRTDITKRKKMEEEIGKAHRFLQGVTNAMGEGVYVLGPYSECTFVNPEAERLLGYGAQELIGNSIHDLTHYQDADGNHMSSADCPIIQSIQRGEVFRSEDQIFTRKDGTTFPVSIVAVPLYEGDWITGSVAVFQDITERVETERQLQEARDVAEEANRSKSDFLANMSHEIRTPMNAVIGFSHLALQTELTDRQMDYLNKIQSSATALLGIINNILDFSKIEAGKLTVESSVFELDDVIDQVCAMTCLRAEEKDLEVMISRAPNIPGTLIGDSLRLSQVLTNLAGNAVKFTHHGDIVISVTIAEKTTDSVLLRFAVKDTGIGLDDTQISRLFQSFSQADTSTTRQYGGTGLGLAISKSLVELMNGEIGVDSEPGMGSTFHFTARFGYAGEETEDEIKPTNLSGRRILVADDRLAAREIFVETLESFGLETVSVDSGKSALEMLEQTSEANGFDFAVIDWKMPGMDGIETLDEIKKSKAIAYKPACILATAYGRDEVVNAIDHLDVVDVLAKPVGPSVLLDSLQKAIGAPGAVRKRVTYKPSRDVDAIQGILGADVLLVEDNEINQQVATELLEGCGLIVSVAENGQKALDALAAGDRAFDVILMDVQMPVMDGYEATANIRANQDWAHVPIVAMTAHALSTDRDMCLDAGMDDHLTKPIDPDILFETLVRWIKPADRTFHEMKKVRIPQTAEALPDSLPGFDIETGLMSVSGNKELYLSLLDQFRNNHADAHIKIKQCVKTGDIETAQRIAHTMKSVTAAIGALKLSKSAIGVEAWLSGDMKEGEKAALDDFTMDLSEVVMGLDRAFKTTDVGKSNSAAASGADIDVDAIKDILVMLSPLLREGDLESLEVVSRIESLVQGTELFSLFEDVKEAIGAFDFETAENKLLQFEEALINVDSGGGG